MKKHLEVTCPYCGGPVVWALSIHGPSASIIAECEHSSSIPRIETSINRIATRSRRESLRCWNTHPWGRLASSRDVFPARKLYDGEVYNGSLLKELLALLSETVAAIAPKRKLQDDISTIIEDILPTYEGSFEDWWKEYTRDNPVAKLLEPFASAVWLRTHNYYAQQPRAEDNAR